MFYVFYVHYICLTMTQIRVETLQPAPNIFILGKELCYTVITLIHKISSIQNWMDPNDSNLQYTLRFNAINLFITLQIKSAKFHFVHTDGAM
jgi:hypothetical protein